jgi:hypothetical protein
MAVEEEEGNVGSDGNGEERLDPENGQAEGLGLLQGMAEKTLEKYLEEIFKAIVENIKKFHLPSVKFLVDLLALLKVRRVVRTRVYESLGQLLLKSCNELEQDGKQKTENGE